MHPLDEFFDEDTEDEEYYCYSDKNLDRTEDQVWLGAVGERYQMRHKDDK